MAEEKSDEVSLEDKVKLWKVQIAERFNDKFAKAFVNAIDELFEEEDELKYDLENEWEDSNLMDQLHSEQAAIPNVKDCKQFYKFIKLIIFDTKEEEHPDDINWEYTDKQIQIAREYMIQQCPGPLGKEQNPSLFALVAVGRTNHVPVLSLLNRAFGLIKIHGFHDPESESRNINDASDWVAKHADYFLNHPKKKLKIFVQNALRDYNKRLAGASVQKMVINRIHDPISNYFEYTLNMSRVIRNLIKSNQECCPFQIDLMILGKYIPGKDDKKDNDQKDNDDDEDDSDSGGSDEIMEMGGFKSMRNVVHTPPNFVEMLNKSKTKFETAEISVNMDNARVVRLMSDAIGKSMGKKRHQRLVVAVDRCAAKKENEPDNDDSKENMYVYKLKGKDTFNKDYCEETLTHLTKTAIIPNYEMIDDDVVEVNPYIGGESDIMDRGFVLSFHIHSIDHIVYEQTLKGQRVPFFPYHMLMLWPNYFSAGFETYDTKKYTVKEMYERWSLPKNDSQLMQWLKVVDPKFYKVMEKHHLQYV